ncbi:ssDNA-binding protein [Candidatus Accumulibacter vicinus]|uniref:Uncharacterized protein n=1 Tax=Candidatus Accumulibacter vicinus TaxID=2954382 RepID=A0A084Y2E5_9PROT|nr:ssDNA-binding protein [Candidatus Accumulibacter vicinus]KFB68889.1 MAG: hypothetical protein CAPSK01_001744 [Candidatus Accumulibacter vicinus]
MKKLNEEGTLVIVPNVRLSYLNVFKPRLNTLRKAIEFSATLLIPKTPNAYCLDPLTTLKELREVVESALKAKFKEIPKKFEPCLLDGDVETDNDGEPKHPGYFYISTRSAEEYPPVLIDGKRKPVLEAKDWVSGDWGNVKLSFYGYEFEGKKGVSTSLRAIQFTRKDEPFGTSADPETVAKEFDEVEEDFLA